MAPRKARYAGVEPRPDRGTIRIRFTFRGVVCRETLPIEPTPRNLKWAAELVAAIRHEIATGRFDYATHFPDSPNAAQFAKWRGEHTTVRQLLEAWLESRDGVLAPSTLKACRSGIYGHLIPELGEIAITAVDAGHLRMLSATLVRRELSRKTINNTLWPLREALAEAADDGQVARSPFTTFRLKTPIKPSEDAADPFTMEEIRAICGACRHRELANLVQFSAWTGLRLSELFALRWSDVDWRAGCVHVRRGRVMGAVKGTKTLSAAGTVKLLAPAHEALQRQRAVTELRGPDSEIWLRPSGAPWSEWALRESFWRPALKRARVRYRGPSQLRHTFASWMLSAGEPVAWVARQLRHTTVQMVVRNYGRWIEYAGADDTLGSRATEDWSTTPFSPSVPRSDVRS